MARTVEAGSAAAIGAGSAVDAVVRSIRSRSQARREHEVGKAFVSIAQALVAGHSLVEVHVALTEACAGILDVASAGLMMADRQGVLQAVGASNGRTFDLELFLLGLGQGPGLDCYRSGLAVSVPDLAAAASRWPNFAPAAVAAGFACVDAVPVRAQGGVLGVLGVYGTRVGGLGEEDLGLAQGLADAAAVTLVTGQGIEDRTALAEQLQGALDSRVVLEQAKGFLAQSGGLEIAAAFVVLRGYARDHNQRLSVLAAAVVARQVPAEVVLHHAATKAASGAPARRRGTAGPGCAAQGSPAVPGPPGE